MTNGMCACRSDNQSERHQHFLLLARDEGMEATERHVREDLQDRLDSRERVQQLTHDIMAWVRDQAMAYRGVVDARTGAPLGWWEGRRQTLRAMHLWYEEIGRQSDARKMAWDQRRDVNGFQRATTERFTQTPLREPGDEEEE